MKDTKRPQTETPTHTGGNNVVHADFRQPTKPFNLIDFIRARGMPRGGNHRNHRVVISSLHAVNDDVRITHSPEGIIS